MKDITKIEPQEDCRCRVLTNRGRTLELDYYEEHGFWDDDGENYGWKDNGYNPELVIEWIKIEEE